MALSLRLPRARRVPVPPAAAAGFDHDYGDAFAVPAGTGAGVDASARRWAELGLAGAERFHRLFGRLAWQLGLGFRLAPRGQAGTLVGWRIVEDTDDRFVLDCDGRLMAGRMVFLRTSGESGAPTITWTTMLTFHGAAGRRVWMLFGIGHRAVTPFALGGAQRALERD